MNASASTPIARRLRALLFQLRAVVVFLGLAAGIIVWMLVGIVGAAIASLVRASFGRRRRGADRTPRSSGWPPDSSSPAARPGVMPTWLRA